ncbi:protein of unknown function [Ruminococcaceae bacterium BL-4]|nr:protein of unknown function [Ruminococcaceae bacterium BL-4]
MTVRIFPQKKSQRQKSFCLWDESIRGTTQVQFRKGTLSSLYQGHGSDNAAAASGPTESEPAAQG